MFLYQLRPWAAAWRPQLSSAAGSQQSAAFGVQRVFPSLVSLEAQ